MTRLAVLAGAAAGAFLGSFLACAAYRAARGIPLGGRSRCDSCGAPVGLWVFLPVLNYLALRGRCRACGGRIPVRYWLVEVSSALLGAGCALRPFLAAGWPLLAGALFLEERSRARRERRLGG